MKRLLNRLMLHVGCAVVLTSAMSCRPTSQAAVSSVAVSPTTLPAATTADALENAAVGAVRSGDFDRGDQLLDQAARISGDPQVREMDQWVKSYEAERATFSAQRHEQFEKAVADVHTLLNHKVDSYAIDEAARAYLLADNREEFRSEKWIDDLIAESKASADADEDSGLWLKALRLYADLGEMEPSNPIWKEKLKLATLRVRLLMEYTPDRLKKLRDLEDTDRQVADNILRASTQPSLAKGAATQPAEAGLASLAKDGGSSTRPANLGDVADSTDWRDVTKGIQYDMLFDALELADRQYYRDVTFQTLLTGGLNGLKAVVTTDGLQDAFPGLADKEKRAEFLTAIDSSLVDAANATPDTAEDVMSQSLTKLRDLNRETVKLPEEVFVSEFADGAFSKLDPFSQIIWPYNVEELKKTTEGEFGGVGIQIENDDAGDLKVVKPLPDTPASKAGIRHGDIITRINGKSAKGISLDGAVNIITGVPGTNVTLTVRTTGGVVKDYALQREIIKVDSIEGCQPKPGGGWNYMIDPVQGIGYIRITSFSKSTSDDLGSALDEVKACGGKALILDLRYNPGGLLQQATEVVNKFIDHGVIVSTHADRPTVNPPTVADATPEDLQTTLPLVVLVNQYSASASEIVSGALKDQKRALIVGERTFGKGSVQMLFPLDTSQGYLKLTTSHYYLPSGRCIHREEDSKTWGVDPDVDVEMTPEQMSAEIEARMRLEVPEDAADQNGKQGPETIQDVLKVDPQLSAALLVLRLQLASQETRNAAAMR